MASLFDGSRPLPRDADKILAFINRNTTTWDHEAIRHPRFVKIEGGAREHMPPGRFDSYEYQPRYVSLNQARGWIERMLTTSKRRRYPANSIEAIWQDIEPQQVVLRISLRSPSGGYWPIGHVPRDEERERAVEKWYEKKARTDQREAVEKALDEFKIKPATSYGGPALRIRLVDLEKLLDLAKGEN